MRELIAADFFAALELRRTVVLVHQRDHVDRNLFRTCCGTLTVIGARTEVLIHGFNHCLSALVTLWLTLW